MREIDNYVIFRCFEATYLDIEISLKHSLQEDPPPPLPFRMLHCVILYHVRTNNYVESRGREKVGVSMSTIDD